MMSSKTTSRNVPSRAAAIAGRNHFAPWWTYLRCDPSSMLFTFAASRLAAFASAFGMWSTITMTGAANSVVRFRSSIQEISGRHGRRFHSGQRSPRCPYSIHSDTARTRCSIKPRQWRTTTLIPMIPPSAKSFHLQRRMGRAPHKRSRQTGRFHRRAGAGAAGEPAAFLNCAHMIVGVVASTRYLVSSCVA